MRHFRVEAMFVRPNHSTKTLQFFQNRLVILQMETFFQDFVKMKMWAIRWWLETKVTDRRRSCKGNTSIPMRRMDFFWNLRPLSCVGFISWLRVTPQIYARLFSLVYHTIPSAVPISVEHINYTVKRRVWWVRSEANLQTRSSLECFTVEKKSSPVLEKTVGLQKAHHNSFYFHF